MKTRQRVPKHRTTVGMLNTDYHSRETMKLLLLDNTKTFQLMYCIFYKMLVIYL